VWAFIAGEVLFVAQAHMTGDDDELVNAGPVLDRFDDWSKCI